jgi:hypothetical protein
MSVYDGNIPPYRPWTETIVSMIAALACVPLIASLVFLAYGLAHMAITGKMATKDWSHFDSAGLGFIIMFFYIRFWIEALCFGLLLSIYGWMRGRPPVVVAVIAALAIMGFDLLLLGGAGRELPQFILLYSAVGIIAWTLLRLMWVPRT